MAEFTYVIKDEIGIHARPAGMLVKLVKELGTPVTVTKAGRTVDAAKLMAVMGLGVKCGDEVTVACGDEAALAKVQAFFEENL